MLRPVCTTVNRMGRTAAEVSAAHRRGSRSSRSNWERWRGVRAGTRGHVAASRNRQGDARRPRKSEARHFEEHVLHIDEHFELHEEAEAKHVETERLEVRSLFVDEAILQLEMAANRPFIVFVNAKTDKVNILQRRKSGGFGLIEVSVPH